MKKDKIELGWKDVSISKYYEILDVIEKNLPEYETNIMIASIVTGMSEDQILEMPLSQAEPIFKSLNFLGSFELRDMSKVKNLTIGGQIFDIRSDLSKITVAQFTDYQTFIKQPLKESLDKILSVFIIPQGCQYNEGYDIIEVQDIIRHQMSFTDAQSLLNFLLAKYVQSLTDSLMYLAKVMKKEKDPKRKKEIEKKLEESNQMLQKFLHSIGCA